MTTEQVLKLDNIQYPEDLAWREESLDAGHPECLCSACGQPILDIDTFIDEETYEEAAANFPIRITNGKGNAMVEAVMHMECYNWLVSQKDTFKQKRNG
jgi:hypothetical protein